MLLSFERFFSAARDECRSGLWYAPHLSRCVAGDKISKRIFTTGVPETRVRRVCSRYANESRWYAIFLTTVFVDDDHAIDIADARRYMIKKLRSVCRRLGYGKPFVPKTCISITRGSIRRNVFIGRISTREYHARHAWQWNYPIAKRCGYFTISARNCKWRYVTISWL